MPLRLDIKRKLANRSDRVKAVDYHPTEPWLLVALYNGNVHIWNHETQALVKSFEATDLPVRAAKFVARKSWIVTGSDDMQVRVFNYNTHEKVITFDAHSDYIRSIAVHNTQPYILTASDDCLIKLWDWDKGWKNVMTFEGHTYFVMHVAFNPKDGNTFASASMDRTIKVWSLGSRVANYTLEGHQKGVNCVDYYTGGDKPYLLSGGDDKLIKVWDYQNKACVQTLEGHTHHVTVVCFHPELPIIVSGSEDGTIRIWHANTYRPENTLNYGMERVWALAFIKGSNDLAFGYDEGTICIKLGRDEPAISMDNSGKVIWARHSEIQTSNVKASGDDAAVQDGERVMLPTKDLGSCEIYPQTLQHSPNGRFVVVCGDGEYIIYTALAWRNKSFGQALEFVWAMDSNEYAIRESASRIRLFKAFKEKSNVNIRLSYSAEGIFGGALLGIRSSTFLIFYDWETGMPVRRVDVVTRSIFWSESDLVAIASDDSFYVLRFNRAAWQAYVESGATPTEEGFEAAFEFVTEIAESVKTGYWVGDCFIYTNAANRLNYLVGGQVSTVSHFDTTMYLLGYLAKDNRIYICDKNLAVTSYALPLSLIEYQTAILRGDMETAMRILPTVPAEQRNKVARFLEGRGLKEEALAVSTDLEHRFELAVQLSRLDLAYEIAKTSNHEHKWKTIGDVALTSWQYGLAEECLRRARDLEGLLLIYQTSGNAAGLEELSKMAAEAGSNNIAFVCHFLLGRTEQCVELLIQTARIPEAALFARTYVPSQIPRVLAAWKASLEKLGKKKAAEALADPSKYANLFPDMEYGLFAEAGFKRRLVERGLPPAANYTDLKDSLDWDIVGQIKERFPNGIPADALHQQQASPMSSAPPSAANGHSARQHATPSASDSASISPASAAPLSARARSPSPTPSPAHHMPPQPPLAQQQQQQQQQQQAAAQQKAVKFPANGSAPASATSSASAHTPLDLLPTSTAPSSVISASSAAAASIPITQLAPPAPIDKNVSQSLLDDDRPDLISDNMSHLSLEVNTTGTGSLRGDIDFDDLASFGGDGMSGGASVAGGGDGPLDDDEIDKLLS